MNDLEALFYQSTVTNLAKYLYQELGIAPKRDYFFRYAHSGPRLLTFALGINPRYLPKLRSLQEQLTLAMALEKEQHIRLARGDRGMLCIEIPKPEGLCYSLPQSALPTGRGWKVPLALDGFYKPIRLNFGHPLQTHTLITGTTGSGKTNGLRLLILKLIEQNRPEDVQFLLIDPSKGGRWFRDFEGLPHLMHPPVTKQDEIAAAMAWTVGELERRGREFIAEPRIFIALDEAQVLLGEKRDIFLHPVSRVASEGREVGMHLILVTQKPDIDSLGSGRIRGLMTNRVIGCVRGANEAYQATGLAESDAHLLTREGDMLFVLVGFVSRGQMPLVDLETIVKLKESAGTVTNRLALPGDREIAQALEGEGHEDGDTDEETVGGFSTKELAISLIGARHREKGRPWLKNVLTYELGSAPGSGRAGRLRDLGRQLRAELIGYEHDLGWLMGLTD